MTSTPRLDLNAAAELLGVQPRTLAKRWAEDASFPVGQTRPVDEWVQSAACDVCGTVVARRIPGDDGVNRCASCAGVPTPPGRDGTASAQTWTAKELQAWAAARPGRGRTAGAPSSGKPCDVCGTVVKRRFRAPAGDQLLCGACLRQGAVSSQ